jgi:hypothetical protein
MKQDDAAQTQTANSADPFVLLHPAEPSPGILASLARQSRVYLAEGGELHMYSVAASALLHYAHLSLESLRMFYTTHLPERGSHILPMLQSRDQFIVRASDLGLE